MLRKGVGAEATKANVKRVAKLQKDTSLAEIEAKFKSPPGDPSPT